MPDTADGYRVLLAPCSVELREKGSTFLAWVHPVADAEDAAFLRDRLGREHRDATHHCWAERIGWPPVERSSDAGEPRGTAGEPIARVLRGHGLSDVTAIVIRWFGGVKLGKGGLARAYAGAAGAALETGQFESRMAMEAIHLRMPYGKVGAVKRLVRPGEVEWIEEAYGAAVEATLRVRLDLESSVRDALADLQIEVRSKPEDRS